MTPEERYKVRKGVRGKYWVADYSKAPNGGICSELFSTQAEAEEERQTLMKKKD